MKIRLSRYTPSLTPRNPKEDLISREVSPITKRIYLESYVIHVMKQEIMQRTVLRNQSQQRRETKEDIMLILQRMMNHTENDPDMKVKILQARMNMF